MAKFKEGDDVIVTSGLYKSEKATIEDVISPRKIYATVHHGGQNLTVEFDENDLRVANSISTNSVVANALAWKNGVACNAATITKDSRGRNGWVSGTVNGQFFEAKVFDEPSEYGINNGRVSKLHIKGKNGEGTAVAYDRGWDVRPSTPQDKFAFKEVMQTLEKLKTVFNSAPVASNADDGSVLVTIKTIDESGLKRLAPVKMTAREFEDWMKKIACGGQLQGVWAALMSGREASVTFPTLGATVKSI